jgi:hypothetical protein
MHDAGPIFSEAGGLSSSRHSITTSATRVLVFDKLSEFAVAEPQTLGRLKNELFCP